MQKDRFPSKRKNKVPSTRSTGYRCSLPGLAGFAGVPSPGTTAYLSQNGAEVYSAIDFFEAGFGTR